MTALFVKPTAFTKLSGDEIANNPISNMNVDVPSLVWRSSEVDDISINIDLGANPVSYDTIALVNTNFRTTDTITIYNTTQSDLNGLIGLASISATDKSIVRTFATQTNRYIRIVITAAGHPDGHIQAQRLVIGKAVTTKGIDSDAEQMFDDRSLITDSNNYTLIDEYSVLPSWKFKASQITEDAWYDDWNPLLSSVGMSKAILFVSDLENARQENITFGRITSQAKAKHRFHDSWQLTMNLRSLST